MKIALLADLHIGFGYNSPRERDRREDSFLMAEEALKLAAEKADAIIIAGDLFDRRNPGIEVLERGARTLNIPHTYGGKGVRIRGVEGLRVDPRAEHGVPIIAVHGNHDTRSGDKNNVLSLFHASGTLVYLHRSTVVLEKGEERVAITGIGWIPDAYAPVYFRERIPPPLPNMYNILVFHQPLKGLYPYPGEVPVDVELLPRGYNAYVTGHFHYHTEKRVGGRWIIIPGSTVRTQLRDQEVLDDRAFFILDTETEDLEEVFIPSARRGFVYRIVAEGDVKSAVIRSIEDALSKNDRKVPPIIKISLEGKTENVPDLSDVIKAYEGRAIVRIFDQTVSDLVKQLNEIGTQYLEERAAFTKEGAEKVLMELMQAAGIVPGPDFHAFFSLLEEGERDRAFRLIENGKVFEEVRAEPHEQKTGNGEGTVEKGKPVKGGSTILDWVSP